MKKNLHKMISNFKRYDKLKWFFDLFIITLIILNVIAIILESIEPLRKQYHKIFDVFEAFSVTIFTVEYILRVFTANSLRGYERPVLGNIKYAFTPLAIIDLLSFLPFYLPFIGVDLRLLRILRIFRVFRLFKIARYVQAISFILIVFKKKKEELIITLIFTLFLLLITSSLMYYIENEAQPDHFSSIPETMWWGISTLTTVGYGDIYPVTPLGKFLGGVISIIGIGLFALPTGILASGFSEEISSRKRGDDYCPVCGNYKTK